MSRIAARQATALRRGHTIRKKIWQTMISVRMSGRSDGWRLRRADWSRSTSPPMSRRSSTGRFCPARLSRMWRYRIRLRISARRHLREQRGWTTGRRTVPVTIFWLSATGSCWRTEGTASMWRYPRAWNRSVPRYLRDTRRYWMQPYLPLWRRSVRRRSATAVHWQAWRAVRDWRRLSAVHSTAHRYRRKILINKI